MNESKPFPYYPNLPECEDFEERAAIMEYDGGLGQAKAEELAGIPKPVRVQPSRKHSPWAHSDQMLSQNILIIPMLVDGLFPKVGVAGIVGPSDSGKSMLARQLAISISCGESHFLLHPLMPKHGKAIYVASEDDRISSGILLKRQWHAIANGNLRYLFAEECNSKILPILEAGIKTDPVDLIVVDTWGDLFAFDAERGTDNNSETAVRKLIGMYSKLAQRYGCLILFVHHTRKGVGNEGPHREHVSGSAALERKFRILVHLAQLPDRFAPLFGQSGDIRTFTIIKGNYLPRSAKEVVHLLLWDESTFRLSDSGASIKLSEYDETLRVASQPQRGNKSKELPVYKPGTYTKKELADIAGLDVNSGTFGRLLQRAIAAGTVLYSGRNTYVVPESADSKQLELSANTIPPDIEAVPLPAPGVYSKPDLAVTWLSCGHTSIRFRLALNMAVMDRQMRELPKGKVEVLGPRTKIEARQVEHEDSIHPSTHIP